MKKAIIVLSVLFLFFNQLQAKKITGTEAANIATNIILEKSDVKLMSIEIEEILLQKYENTDVYFIVKFQKPVAFVIVSAHNTVLPILAYSFEGQYKDANQPPQFVAWMNHYAKEIKYAVQNEIKTTASISNEWKKYNCDSRSFRAIKDEKIVEPLLGDIIWNQGAGWNDECPEDPEGSGGHVYAGCVATAAGMVMKYWNYPAQGVGTHGYNSAYGYLEANFGETEYHFENMSNTESTYEAALLLYHIGIGVEMSYSPNGSGAYTSDAVEVLNEHFKYSNSYIFDAKENYTEEVWIEMLKNNLDYGLPLIYRGYGEAGGHAFCCDGYDNEELFHFNWGWSGSYNGYFEISNLNPASYTFSDDCGAGFGVVPAREELAMPQNIEIERPNYDQVIINWEAPATKNLVGYVIYKNGLIVSELDASATSYAETSTEEATYFYGVKAVYDNPVGESDCEIFEVSTSSVCDISFHVTDATNENPIYPATVIFDGETATTGFSGMAYFSDLPWDTEQHSYSVEADNYESAEGTTDLQGSHQVEVFLTPLVNIEEINSSVSIFPNPTTGKITISNYEKISITITDINGKIIFEEIADKQNYSLNLGNNNPGVYFIQIRAGQNIINRKIVLL